MRSAAGRRDQGDERRRKLYGELLTLARKVVRQAGRVTKEIGEFSREKQRKAKDLIDQIGTMSDRVCQVIRRTKARVFGGETKVPGKIVSVFETHTEIIRKGKASKPTEFGKMVKIHEAENQVITDYEVFEERPNDSDLLISSVDKHEECFGRTPELVAADAAFYSSANEKALQENGSQAYLGTEPKHAERGSAHHPETAMVQTWAAMADRLRRADKRFETSSRSGPLPISWTRWDESPVGLGVIANNLISIRHLNACRQPRIPLRQEHCSDGNDQHSGSYCRPASAPVVRRKIA